MGDCINVVLSCHPYLVSIEGSIEFDCTVMGTNSLYYEIICSPNTPSNLIPRPHPLMKKRGLVTTEQFLVVLRQQS